MRKVTMNKDDLRKIIQENQKEHKKRYEKAHNGFRKKLIANLESMLDRAKNGGEVNLYVDLVEPTDHSDDYIRVLSMLEHEIGDTVVLDSTEYSQYVQDDWGWKQQWYATTAAFVAPDANP